MRNVFGKFVRAALLALTLAASAGVSFAQTSGPGGGNAGGAGTHDTRADRGSDWSWVGLIGLLGLAGLAGMSRRNHDAARRDVGTISGASVRH